MSTPTGCPQPESPPALTQGRSFMAAILQTALQVAGRGGRKHSPHDGRRQGRAHTLRPPSPRTIEQLQACSSNRSFMKLHGGFRCRPNYRRLVVAASTLHTSAGGREEHAPGVCTRLAPSSSRKLAQPVGASWQLRCRATYRRLAMAASTLRTMEGDRDEHAPGGCHRLAPSSSRKLTPPVGGQ